MTVSYEQINIKFILAAVSLFSIVAGGGGSWGVMKLTVGNLTKEHNKDRQTFVETTEKMTRKIDSIADVVSLHDYHATNTDIHMPYMDKVKTFVPRNAFDEVKEAVHDLDTRQRSISTTLQRIEAKLDQ